MTAAETAYYVSIYAHSNDQNIQLLTSHVRAAPLVGRIVASLLAQLIISQEWLTYKELHFFNLAGKLSNHYIYFH